MKLLEIGFLALVTTLFSVSCNRIDKNTFNFDDMLIRIAGIEIDSTHLDEYIAILQIKNYYF